jgi:hypothetical protein
MSQLYLEAVIEATKSRVAERGTKMLIVTSIYCARLDPVHDAATGKIMERSIADLKDASRNLVSVHQGTNRMHPIDGER